MSGDILFNEKRKKVQKKAKIRSYPRCVNRDIM